MERARVHPAIAVLAAVLGLIVCLMAWQWLVAMVGRTFGDGTGEIGGPISLWGMWLLGAMAVAGTVGALTARLLPVPARKFANLYAVTTGLIIGVATLGLLPGPLDWLNDLAFRTVAVDRDPLLLAVTNALGPSGAAALGAWMAPQSGTSGEGDPSAFEDLMNEAAEAVGGQVGERFRDTPDAGAEISPASHDSLP